MKESEVVNNEKGEKVTTAQPVMARTVPHWLPWVVAGLIALLVAMVAYGIGYHMSNRGFVGRSGFGVGMMRGGGADDFAGNGAYTRGPGMGRGTVGTVTAVSSSSITIKDTVRGGTVTYTIDGNTKVTENGTTKAVSDIKTGDTVRVYATGSDTTVATDITLGTY